ncbi:MAG TPA: hypothetical protein VFA10_07305 [Ktedonobacteraceae bacterium]|nr:hypothetical protein [Ktedonobacteraceae bacterium]
MYNNDLTGLLRMSNKTRANGVISTKGIGPGEPWQAHLTFFQGQVITCHVWSSVNGRSLLTDYEALHWLANLGYLAWNQEAFTPQQTSLLFDDSQVDDSQAALLQSYEIPRRLRQVERAGMHSWSRKHRQVFALVDGRRSTERIAVILCQPLKVVEIILHDLQSKGVIVVDRIAREWRGEEGIA